MIHVYNTLHISWKTVDAPCILLRAIFSFSDNLTETNAFLVACSADMCDARSDDFQGGFKAGNTLFILLGRFGLRLNTNCEVLNSLWLIRLFCTDCLS